MKTLTIFSFIATLALLNSSCKNDHNEYGQMKGINYYSRNDAISFEELSFDNASGISNDTLKRKGLLNIAANTFTNADGSAFTGKVIVSVRENYVRGFMALNSVPTTSSDGKPMSSEGTVYISAFDIQGNELKIASGKNIELKIPGGAVPNQYKLYYANDNVKDPAPANTALFNWNESSTDTVEYYFDTNAGKYYYSLKPTQLGWISCARIISNSNPVGIKVRVLGVSAISATNTAVYVVPVNGKSAYRLWNYDKASNLFSLDQPYLNNGSSVYVIAIASSRHFRIFYAKELVSVGVDTQINTHAIEVNLSAISANLYIL